MVRIRLYVKIIPEDVYLKDVESPTPTPATKSLPQEKLALHLVAEPERMTIGTLANKAISPRYHNDPLGEIKYLKDGDFDADLDPQMTIYDAFVDAGKATVEPGDQKAFFKIIREVRGQTFGVREGSVVPDLRHPRFQPRTLPPVPGWSDTNQSLGKRSRDTAFEEEALSDKDSHDSPQARRRRRPDFAQEDGVVERDVPSIEQVWLEPPFHASRRRCEPPCVPETQSSPPLERNGTDAERDGSFGAGEYKPKSESPEVGDSIHSLPLAANKASEVEIIETVPSSRDPAPIESGLLRDAQFPSGTTAGTTSAKEPGSPSPSNHYSIPSGSSRPVSKASPTLHESASDPAGSTSRLNRRESNNLSRTKSDLARVAAVQKGPMTPPSDASHPRRVKSTADDPIVTAFTGSGPQPGSSSFSSKFRKRDRANVVESEIDDTQMSPGSRERSIRRTKSRNSSTAASKMAKEMSGLFHHVTESRPLIQEQKRPRKETKWDFSEVVEGLSDGDEIPPPNKNHVPPEAGHPSSDDANFCAANQANSILWRRSESRSRSDSTGKDSNASTERPSVISNQNSNTPSHHAADRIQSPDGIVGGMVTNESDKENTNDEHVHGSRLLSTQKRLNQEGRKRRPRSGAEGTVPIPNQDNAENDGAGSVNGGLDNPGRPEGGLSASAKARRVQSTFREVSEPLELSSSLGHKSLKKASSRRKTGDADTAERPVDQQGEHDPAANGTTSKPIDVDGRQGSRSNAPSTRATDPRQPPRLINS